MQNDKTQQSNQFALSISNNNYQDVNHAWLLVACSVYYIMYLVVLICIGEKAKAVKEEEAVHFDKIIWFNHIKIYFSRVNFILFLCHQRQQKILHFAVINVILNSAPSIEKIRHKKNGFVAWFLGFCVHAEFQCGQIAQLIDSNSIKLCHNALHNLLFMFFVKSVVFNMPLIWWFWHENEFR